MINLKVYGKPSSAYEYMKNIIRNSAENAGIQLNLEEFTDTESFIENKVMSIPAYQLNGEIVEKGQQRINDFINKLQLEVLKKENFGNMKKIFVPIDYSDTADNAVTYAINFSKSLSEDVAIRLIHAYRPVPVSFAAGFIESDVEVFGETRLAEYKDKISRRWIGDSGGTLIDAELKLGFAVDEIQKLSKNHPNDWVVMGNSQSTDMAKNIFGSVSTAIAKTAEGPVFIIPPGASFKPFDRIAFCSSDDHLDIECLNDLSKIASIFDSEVHIIHAENGNPYSEIDLVNAFKNNYPKSRIKFSTISGENQIVAVNAYCEENQIDLVALSRKKRSLFGEFFHSSFTKRISITTDIPLLILHK